jgi:hypothetical protein
VSSIELLKEEARGFEQDERAVDFYMDAGLPNNAVAVCKKAMRNFPDRRSIHLKMGQIRARQGFITDARASFVTYTERVQAAGDMVGR